MRVIGAELQEIRLPLREPFVSSAGPRFDRQILLLRVLGSEGEDGWSECVAGETPAYAPETTETAWHVLTRFILPGILGKEVLDPAQILSPVQWIRGHHMAMAAVEMACWDLQAKELGVPLRELVGGDEQPVAVGVVIGVQGAGEEWVRRVREARSEGYALVKLKVRIPADLPALRAVREALPDGPLGVDLNGGCTLRDLPFLQELDALDLTMIEQPLAPSALLDHARLQGALRTPICLDESITGEDELRLALELESCRMVTLKPGLVGGLHTARRLHDLCRSRRVPLRVGGMLESGIGRAHNLALASLPGFDVPADLSESRRYWERDLVAPEFELRDGRMPPTRGAGIGVDPDRTRIRALSFRREGFGTLAGTSAQG